MRLKWHRIWARTYTVRAPYATHGAPYCTGARPSVRVFVGLKMIYNIALWRRKLADEKKKRLFPRDQSGFELNRQLGPHSKMAPPRKIPSGPVTKNMRPVLGSAGPADAAGTFIILLTSPEILCFFGMGPQLAV
jgi:hypothetical protein